MEDIDKLIKETLSEEEAKFYKELEQQNMFRMIQGLFVGKNKWLMVGMNLVTVIFFGIFLYCVVQLLDADSTMDLIQWATGSIIFLIVVSMLKIFAWLQMNKNALLREIKRVEVIILSLSGKIKD